jgi:hypothetical protein
LRIISAAQVVFLDGAGINCPALDQVPAEQLDAVATRDLGHQAVGGLPIAADLPVHHVQVVGGRKLPDLGAGQQEPRTRKTKAQYEPSEPVPASVGRS